VAETGRTGGEIGHFHPAGQGDRFIPMNLDIEDVLAGALASVVVRAILFGVAVWLGCTVGAAAMLAGHIAEAGSWRIGVHESWIWASPLLLVNVWALLNIPFLFCFLVRFLRDESDDFLTFGIVVGVESIMVMAGWANHLVHGRLPLAVAGFTWLLLLIMIGTGVWLIRQHLINTWARRLAMIRAANAQKLARKEEQERARKQPKGEL
jgi:hypothetical protein